MPDAAPPHKRGRELVFLTPGTAVLFHDSKCGTEGDEEGRNNVAFVIDQRGALFQRGRRVRSIPIDALTSLQAALLVRPEPDLGEAMATFFYQFQDRPMMFKGGVNAFLQGNQQPFTMGNLFPTRRNYSDLDAYEKAWASFRNTLKPGDAVFTVSPTSFTSRVIAWFTHGPWSHVALHIGNGEILEAVPGGPRHVDVDHYKCPRNWVAAYRHVRFLERDVSKSEIDGWIEYFKSLPNGYNYLEAAKHGLRTFIGDLDDVRAPNALIYRGLYVFKAQA